MEVWPADSASDRQPSFSQKNQGIATVLDPEDLYASNKKPDFSVHGAQNSLSPFNQDSLGSQRTRPEDIASIDAEIHASLGTLFCRRIFIAAGGENIVLERKVKCKPAQDQTSQEKQPFIFRHVTKVRRSVIYDPRKDYRYVTWNARKSRLQQFFSARLDREEEKDTVVSQRHRLIRDQKGYREMKIQMFVPEILIPHYQLRGGYAEKEAMTGEYQTVNEVLIQGRRRDAFTLDLFLRTQDSPALDALVQATEKNDALREYLRRLIDAMIDYSHETGELFDTIGNDNIILFPAGDGDCFAARFIDPLHAMDDTLYCAQDACSRLQNFPDGMLSNEQKIALLNCINYTRTVNGLAMALGMSKRFMMLPAAQNEHGSFIDFEKMHAQLHIVLS